MQFASFKVKIQMEEVLFFRNRGERAVWGDMAYGHHIPRTTHRQKEPPPDFAELQR